jgi:hypothetical protein
MEDDRAGRCGRLDDECDPDRPFATCGVVTGGRRVVEPLVVFPSLV